MVDADKIAKHIAELEKYTQRLVHDYLYLDHDKVYDNFLKVPSILQQYLFSVKSFLKIHSA